MQPSRTSSTLCIVMSQVMSVGRDRASSTPATRATPSTRGCRGSMTRRADEPSPSRTRGRARHPATARRRATHTGIGELIWLVPGHCDPTVNLHDRYVAIRGGLAEGRVERLICVDARGALT